MNIDKNELSRKIGQLKGIVPKSSTMDGLQGILYQDGYLIASDAELTVKAKLEGIEDEAFVIPVKAFDLISSLPDGDVDIGCAKDTVTIKMGNIKNKFKTYSVDKFAYARSSMEESVQASISADKFKDAISHVLYAIPSNGANAIITGMYLECSENKLNLVGLDGKRIAIDKIEYSGDFKLIVPKAAMEKIVQLNIDGEMSISYDARGALFKTDEYEIYTRLITGTYFAYDKMLKEGDIQTVVDRKTFYEAINRARLCGSSEDKAPIKLFLDGNSIQITYKNTTADYSEDVTVQKEFSQELKIAFDPKLLIESLKSFSCDNISMAFTAKNIPVLIKAEDSEMTALVLPVNF